MSKKKNWFDWIMYLGYWIMFIEGVRLAFMWLWKEDMWLAIGLIIWAIGILLKSIDNVFFKK